MNDEIVECPCYRVCAGLGLDMNQWCRYRKADLPPPGMRRFDPKETWCPPGVQAAALMLAHLAAGGSPDPDERAAALERIRRWSQGLPLPTGGQ